MTKTWLDRCCEVIYHCNEEGNQHSGSFLSDAIWKLSLALTSILFTHGDESLLGTLLMPGPPALPSCLSRNTHALVYEIRKGCFFVDSKHWSFIFLNNALRLVLLYWRENEFNKWEDVQTWWVSFSSLLFFLLLDPYVKVSLICDGRRLKKKKTSIKKNTLNPTYNEAIVFDIPPDSMDHVSLHISVMDYDLYVCVKLKSLVLFLIGDLELIKRFNSCLLQKMLILNKYNLNKYKTQF